MASGWKLYHRSQVKQPPSINWKKNSCQQLYSLQCRHLIRVSSCYRLAIVYPTSHVWFGVRVDGGVWGEGKANIYSPIPIPLLNFDCCTPPWCNFLSLPSLPLPLKSEMAGIIFAEKILSTCLPKSCLLCRLAIIVSKWWHFPLKYR